MYVFAAGLLAVLSLLHIASSALGRRDPCQSNVDSVGESLLNSRQENYDRFEEVLVSIRKIGENLSRSSRLNFISYLSVYFFRNIDLSYTHFFSIVSIHHCLLREVTEVLDDGVSGPGRCPGDSDSEM